MAGIKNCSFLFIFALLCLKLSMNISIGKELNKIKCNQISEHNKIFTITQNKNILYCNSMIASPSNCSIYNVLDQGWNKLIIQFFEKSETLSKSKMLSIINPLESFKKLFPFQKEISKSLILGDTLFLNSEGIKFEIFILKSKTNDGEIYLLQKLLPHSNDLDDDCILINLQREELMLDLNNDNNLWNQNEIISQNSPLKKLEKKLTTKTNSLILDLLQGSTEETQKKCPSPCQNGICYDGKCLCSNGYFGKQCEIVLSGELRVSLIILLLIFLAVALIALIITCSLWFAIKNCCCVRKFEFGGQMHFGERWEGGRGN